MPGNHKQGMKGYKHGGTVKAGAGGGKGRMAKAKMARKSAKKKGDMYSGKKGK